MEFFDLNIPYHESDRHIVDKAAIKTLRLKLALKAMELGYTGIAFNRNHKGVMSESDRCSIHLFPLSSLLKLVPATSALSAAVKFHRELLNVPVSSPFRQYTRLTVTVDTPSQISTLNAGNPILRSYDIIAVRPLNQNAFDQACQTSEVDIIAIDFSERLPFKLRQPMVKAAISRGVCFEVTYSGFIGDAQTRRLLISNGKLLVEWTRGKNLIFSSAASSATELRGPQDVSNLLSLLGLSMEHAKASISKSCSSLISKAMKKKQFYKEAVKVECIPHAQVKPHQFVFDEWLKWDPISSGEGDLLLDDMQKSFCLSNSATATVRNIDFNSTMNGLPAHGLQIKDLVSGTNPNSDRLHTANEHSSVDVEASNVVSILDLPGERNACNSSPEKKDRQPKIQGDCDIFPLKDGDPICHPPELLSGIPAFEEDQTSGSNENIKHQVSDFADSTTTPVNSSTKENFDADELLQDKLLEICGRDDSPDGNHFTLITEKAKHDPVSDNKTYLLDLSNESEYSTRLMKELSKESRCVGVIAQQGVLHSGETERGTSSASLDESLQNIYVEGEQCKENDAISLGDGSPDLMINLNEAMEENVAGDRKLMEHKSKYQDLDKSSAVGRRRKRSIGHQPFLFPFKHFLKPCHLKRKMRKVAS